MAFSTQELTKLRIANDVARQVLSGQLKTINSENAQEFANDSCFERDQNLLMMDEKMPQGQHCDNYHDIWGATQFLATSSKIDFVRQHLENTKAILTKNNTLLRISEPVAYETVDDTDLLLTKEAIPTGRSDKCLEIEEGGTTFKYADRRSVAEDRKLRSFNMAMKTQLVVGHQDTRQHSPEMDIVENNSTRLTRVTNFKPNIPENLEPQNTLYPTPQYGENKELSFLGAILQGNDDQSQDHDKTSHCTRNIPEEQSVEFHKQLTLELDDRPNAKEKSQKENQDRSINVIQGNGDICTRTVSDQTGIQNQAAVPTSQKHRAKTLKRLDPTMNCGKGKHEYFILPSSAHELSDITKREPLLKKEQKPKLLDVALDLNSLVQNVGYGLDNHSPYFIDPDFKLVECKAERKWQAAKSKPVFETQAREAKSKPLKVDLKPPKTMPVKTARILISSMDFASVWDMLPNELVLIIFSYLSQQDLKRISIVCQRFNSIAKDTCLWLKAEAVDMEVTSQWLDSFSRVQQLSFVRCKANTMSVQILRQFFRKCKASLKQIHITQCMHRCLYGDNIILLASTYCKKLESVSIPWSNTTDNGISALETSNLTLKELDISGNCFISDCSLVPLLGKTGNSLQTLKVNGCFALTNASFSAIADNCHNLAVLQLGLCPKVTSDCLVHLSQSLTDLQELDLRGLKFVNDVCLDSVSRNCKAVTKLVLANCQLITDNSVSNLAVELPNLKDLDLSGCPKVTDNGCCSLANSLRSPSRLNLSSTSISHISVSALTERFFDSLESLKLSFCSNITQDCIERLVSFCFRLNCLHIHGCKRLRIKELQENRTSLDISH